MVKGIFLQRFAFILSLVLVLVGGILTPAYCEEPSISSDVSPRSGSIDDTYTFSVTIEGTQLGAAPALDGGADFSVTLLGPQTSVSIINGDIKSRVTFVYQLLPKKEGTLFTPSAAVSVGGKRMRTQPIEVKVTNSPSNESTTDNREFFLRQSVNSEEVYEGQQIVDTLSLFTRRELKDLSLEEVTVDGVWEEPYGQEQHTTKEINGTTYSVVQLKKALYPLKSDQITLPKRTVSAKIIERTGSSPFGDLNPFSDDFFNSIMGNGRAKNVKIRSSEINVKVKPLPERPSSYPANDSSSPIVGATSIKVNYSPDVIKVGASKTIEVEVTSEGNLNPLKSVNIEEADSVKIYPEQTTITSDSKGPALIMHKTFRFTLVPVRPGLLRIPSPKITYFDPASGSYKVAETSDIGLAVEGTPVAGYTPQQPQQRPAQPAVQDQHTPEPKEPQTPAYRDETFLEKAGKQISLSLALFCLAIVICIVGIIGLGFYVARNKPRTALNLQPIDQAGGFSELNEVVRRLLSKQLNLGKPQPTKDEIRAGMQNGNWDPARQLETMTLLDDLDAAIFSGETHESEQALTRLKSKAKRALVAR